MINLETKKTMGKTKLMFDIQNAEELIDNFEIEGMFDGADIEDKDKKAVLIPHPTNSKRLYFGHSDLRQGKEESYVMGFEVEYEITEDYIRFKAIDTFRIEE